MGLFRRRSSSRSPKERAGAPAPQDTAERGADEPSPVVHIDARSFFDETANGHTIVDFWAPWCGPCVQFAPAFDALAREYEGRVRFAKLNVDDNPDIAAMLQIRSIPSLVVFDPDGNEATRFTGIPPRRDLTDVLDGVASP